MADIFCIHLGSGDQVTWSLAGQASRHGSLQEAAEQSAGRRAVVLVPAADVTLTGASMPTAQRQRLRQAVPFALEEQLAADVERLHFALGKRDKSGWLPVAVADRACMDRWFAALNEAGIHSSAMLPDVLALPLAENGWTILLKEGEALLRTGRTTGFAFDPALAETFVGIALDQAEVKPEGLRIYDCAQGDVEAIEQAARAYDIAVHTESCAAGDVAIFARGVAEGVELDLLQGDYSRREQIGRLWRPWRPAAAMAGVLLLVQGGMAAAEYARLSGEAERLTRAVEETYREAFPEARNVVDPKVQMERRLQALRGGGGTGGFGGLMATAGPVLAGAEGASISALRYKDQGLQVELRLANLQELDRLKQQLSQAGLRVQIDTASSEKGHVESRLTVQEAG